MQIEAIYEYIDESEIDMVTEVICMYHDELHESHEVVESLKYHDELPELMSETDEILRLLEVVCYQVITILENDEIPSWVDDSEK